MHSMGKEILLKQRAVPVELGVSNCMQSVCVSKFLT